MAARRKTTTKKRTTSRKRKSPAQSTALARRAPTRVVVRESGPGSVIVASGGGGRGRGRALARRSGGGGRGGGMLGSVGKWFGDPRTDDLIASTALGWVVGNRRATVDEVLSKAPDFIRPIGGFGIAALGFGALGELVPGLRRWTKPLARQASNLAAYHLGRRGSLYDAKGDIIAGLDDGSDDAAGSIDANEAAGYERDGEQE